MVFRAELMQKSSAAVWPGRTLFFSSGFAYAVWGVGVAVVDHKFALSTIALSLALFAVSLGAIITMRPAGRLIARLGSAQVCQIGALLQAVVISLIMQADSYPLLLLLLLAFGAANAVFDTAMNAQAIAVEAQLNRSLLSTMHAMFSFGGICGAGLGSVCLEQDWPIADLFYLSALLTLVFSLMAGRLFSPDPLVMNREQPQQPQHKRSLLLVACLAFLALLAEGAMYDWSAVFMRDVVLAQGFWIGSAYASFSAGMMIGRLFGDRLRTAYGDVLVLTASGGLAVLGLMLVLIEPIVLVSVIGFASVGLGCANLIPIVFKAAANADYRHAGEAIAYVSQIGYLGFLLGPVLIGFLASQFGLLLALATVGLCAFLIAVMAKSVLSSSGRLIPLDDNRRN